jgi:hypothetical protein
MTEIPDEVARHVFDIAVNSMDFGSGFLDDEEVTALRAYAEAIGVDPDEGTPNNMKHRYPHRFEPGYVIEKDQRRIPWTYVRPLGMVRDDDEIPPDAPQVCAAATQCAQPPDHPLHTLS